MCLYKRLANFMISDEHLENDEVTFQMCVGIRSPKMKEYKKYPIHIVFVT